MSRGKNNKVAKDIHLKIAKPIHCLIKPLLLMSELINIP